MATVTLDYSEFDTLNKRINELEKANNELKEENNSLKDNKRVIVRVKKFRADPDATMPKGKIPYWEDSYVNFEDVRLKVEEAFKDKLKKQIEDYEKERDEYVSCKNKLTETLSVELERKYERENNRKIEAANKGRCKAEKEYFQLKNKLNAAVRELKAINDSLYNRFFVPNDEINRIRGVINQLTEEKCCDYEENSEDTTYYTPRDENGNFSLEEGLQ